jgi:type IV pilus assembly protein PilC
MMTSSSQPLPSPNRPPAVAYAPAGARYLKRRAPDSVTGLLLSLLAWYGTGVLALGILYGALAGTGLVLFPMVFGALFLFPAIRHAQRQARQRQADIVIDALAEAVQMKMPLIHMLWAMEQPERGRFRRRLKRCREFLHLLAVALEETMPEIERAVLESLRAAEQAGQLGPALQRQADDRRVRIADDPHRQGSMVIAYAFTYGVCFITVLALFAIVVLPKFTGIFRDFKLPLPVLSRMFMQLGDESLLVALPIVLGAILALYCGRVVWSLFSPRTPRGLGMPGLTDRLTGWIPMVGQVRRNQALARALALSADAADAGIPLHEAVAQAAEADVHRPTTLRLRHWAARLAAGQPLGAAAQQARLPQLVADMLGAAERSASVPQSLRFLAAHYQHRFSRSLLVLQNAAVPMITLVFAGLTLTVWILILGPLLQLLDAISTIGRLL